MAHLRGEWGGVAEMEERGAHISDVPGLVKQISTPADENASIMSVAAMLSIHPVEPQMGVGPAPGPPDR